MDRPRSIVEAIFSTQLYATFRAMMDEAHTVLPKQCCFQEESFCWRVNLEGVVSLYTSITKDFAKVVSMKKNPTPSQQYCLVSTDRENHETEVSMVIFYSACICEWFCARSRETAKFFDRWYTMINTYNTYERSQHNDFVLVSSCKWRKSLHDSWISCFSCDNAQAEFERNRWEIKTKLQVASDRNLVVVQNKQR